MSARAWLVLVATPALLCDLVLAASHLSPGRETDATRPSRPSTTRPGVLAPLPLQPIAEPAPAPTYTFDLLMTGDVLLHDALWLSARQDALARGKQGLDFRAMLAPMRPTIAAADVAICHLETPLATPSGPFSGYPLFSAPPQIVPALLWAGYDACTTASNHTVDQGFAGIVRTTDALDRAELPHTGSYAERRGAGAPLMIDVPTHGDDGSTGSATVAIISATYGLNGLPLPVDAPWSVNLIDTDRIREQSASAVKAGADFVVVALHWGDEYVHLPSDFQRRVARGLARSPHIGLIYGHHAHVVQPYDKVRDTWVLYGLGNAVAHQDREAAERWYGNAASVSVSARPGKPFHVTSVGYTPTLMTPYSGASPSRYLNAVEALGQSRWAALRDSLRLATRHVRQWVGALGAFREGVRRR